MMTLRARRAAMALGALLTMTTVAALPAAMAQSDAGGAPPATDAQTPTTTARAAATKSIVPGARRLDVVSGSRAHVRGQLFPATAGRRVSLQQRSAGRWHAVDHAATDARGRFALGFRPRRPGSAPVRLHAGAVRKKVGQLNVYRPATASWYGPGLYGNHLGCGGRLYPTTLGVANKTMPCGTRLTLRHGSRRVHVRVIDRGPYVAGREFDLTAATRDRLHFSGVGTVLVNR
jgi:rare lipoprotein A